MFVDKKLVDIIDFEYNLNHKVNGLSIPFEAYELNYECSINKLFEPTFPTTIGYFEVVVYDLKKANHFNHLDETIELIKEMSIDFDSRFNNIHKLFEDYDLDIKSKDRLIILRNCVIHPDWRGKGILNEVMKSIYLTLFSDNSIFVVNTSPLQNSKDELEFLMTDYITDIQDGDGNFDEVLVGQYFQLDDLPEVDEEHDYKLYAKMINMNFKQFEDSNYFYQDNETNFLKIFNK